MVVLKAIDEKEIDLLSKELSIKPNRKGSSLVNEAIDLNTPSKAGNLFMDQI